MKKQMAEQLFIIMVKNVVLLVSEDLVGLSYIIRKTTKSGKPYNCISSI